MVVWLFPSPGTAVTLLHCTVLYILPAQYYILRNCLTCCLLVILVTFWITTVVTSGGDDVVTTHGNYHPGPHTPPLSVSYHLVLATTTFANAVLFFFISAGTPTWAAVMVDRSSGVVNNTLLTPCHWRSCSEPVLTNGK